MKALLTIVLLTLILWPGRVVAQTPHPTEKFSGYAIRFQIRDDLASFSPIFGSGTSVGFTVSPSMSRDPPPHYSALVSMIDLTAKLRGDEWELTVSVLLPKGEKKRLAFARLKAGAKIKVVRFEDYDLLPSEVSIVKIDRSPPLNRRLPT